MPLFNKKEKKKYQHIAANYIPLPEVKELTPLLPELSPTTSVVESASKPQEDPFVRPYYKGNVKEPSLDYATIEYVDSEILSLRPAKQQIKQDPFKLGVPLDNPIKDEGQEYMDMSNLITKKVEDLSISPQRDLPPPPTPPKRERENTYLSILLDIQEKKWDDLHSEEKRDYLLTFSSQICYDCGEVEEPGFRQFYGHDCLRKSYSPGEVAGFIKFCIKCHSFFDSITEMIFHNVDCQCRLPSVRCVSIGCGRLYFNDQAHDLHILRLHGGWFNFNSALKKMYGPHPSCF